MEKAEIARLAIYFIWLAPTFARIRGTIKRSSVVNSERTTRIGPGACPGSKMRLQLCLSTIENAYATLFDGVDFFSLSRSCAVKRFPADGAKMLKIAGCSTFTGMAVRTVTVAIGSVWWSSLRSQWKESFFCYLSGLIQVTIRQPPSLRRSYAGRIRNCSR